MAFFNFIVYLTILFSLELFLVHDASPIRQMEEGHRWVLVKKPCDRDAWSPTLLSSNSGSNSGSDPLKIRFNEPAKYWTDALPIGNGRLGAMVWGGVPAGVVNRYGKGWGLFFFFSFLRPDS